MVTKYIKYLRNRFTAVLIISLFVGSATSVNAVTFTDNISVTTLTTNFNMVQSNVMYPWGTPSSSPLAGSGWSQYTVGNLVCSGQAYGGSGSSLMFNTVTSACTAPPYYGSGVDFGCAYIVTKNPVDMSGRAGGTANVSFRLWHETYQNTRPLGGGPFPNIPLPWGAAQQNRTSDTVAIYVGNTPTLSDAIYVGATCADVTCTGAGWQQHTFALPLGDGVDANAFNGCKQVYIFVVGKTWFSRRNIYIDDISYDYFPTRMAPSSATINTQNTLTVSQSQTNCNIIGIKITTCGSLNGPCARPVRLDSMLFLATGTNPNNDILNAKLFYTGGSPVFATATQVFATATSLTNATNAPLLGFGDGAVLGTTPGPNLIFGDNYFWLTYDIKSTATVGNIVDADFMYCKLDTCGTIWASNPQVFVYGTQGTLAGGCQVGISYGVGTYITGTAWAGYTNNDYISSVYVTSTGGGDPLLNQKHDNTIPFNTNGGSPICSGIGGSGGQWCERHSPHQPDYTLFAPANLGSGKDRTLILKAGQGKRTGSANELVYISAGTWFSANNIKVWIDWNGDGDFNDSINGAGGWISEYVGFGSFSTNTNMSPIGYPATGSGRPFDPAYVGTQWNSLPLHVPQIGDVVTGGSGANATILPKSVRMRVREVWATSTFTPTSSGHGYGETEDYDITIVEDCPLPGSNQCKWLGGATGNPTDWFTAANWCPGIPTATDEAIIGAVTQINGISYYPIIKQNQNPVCSLLNIKNPAIVTIDASEVFVAGNPNTLTTQTGKLKVYHNVQIGETPNTSSAQFIHQASYNATVISGAPSVSGNALISPFRPDKTDNKLQWIFSPTELQVMGINSGDLLNSMTLQLRNAVAMVSVNTGTSTIRMWQTDNNPVYPTVLLPATEVAVNNSAPNNVPSTGAMNNAVIVYGPAAVTTPAFAANITTPFTINFTTPYIVDETKYLVVEYTKDGSFTGAGTPGVPILYEATIPRNCLSITPSINAVGGLVAATMAGLPGPGFTVGITTTGTNAVLAGGVLTANAFVFRPNTTFGVTKRYSDYLIEVHHNWTNNGPNGGVNFVGGKSRVKFMATTKLGFAQGDTLNGSQATTFNKLEIDEAVGLIPIVSTNILGGGAYPFNNPGMVVDSNLILTNGVLFLNQHLLQVNNPLPSAMVRTNGHIYSEHISNNNRVKWKMGGTTGLHTFPFGNATGYVPFTFELKSGTFGDVIASTYPTAANNLPFPSNPVTVNNLYNQVSCLADNSPNTIDRFWQIDVSNPGGGGNSKLEFTYLLSELTGNLSAASIGDLRASRFNSTAARALACGGIIPAGTGVWATGNGLYSQANFATGQTTGAGYTGQTYAVQADNVTAFSPWTLSSAATGPLPVNLLNFNAKAVEKKVKVYWTTASELNIDKYDVERTIDKEQFSYIGMKKAIGPAANYNNYELFDNEPVQGTQYYRLKIIDNDGIAKYSQLAPVNFSNQQFGINTIYVDASSDMSVSFNYDSELPYTYMITDMLGRVIMISSEKSAVVGTNQLTLPVNLAQGMYSLTIRNSEKSTSRNFVY